MINGSLEKATSLDLEKDFLDGFDRLTRRKIMENISKHNNIIGKKFSESKKTFSFVRKLILAIEKKEYKKDFIVSERENLFLETPRFKMEIPEITNSSDNLKIVVGWNFIAVPTSNGKSLIVPLAAFSVDTTETFEAIKQKFEEKLKEKPLIVKQK